MSKVIAHHVNGALYAGQGSRQQPVTNPATGAVSAQVKLGTGCCREPCPAYKAPLI